MKAKQVEQGHIICLFKGEKIAESLQKYCEGNNLRLGLITAIGAASDITLGHFSLESKEYTEKIFNRSYEIISLKGNLTEREGKSHLHLHVTLSDDEMKIVGGHLKEGTASATCEVFILALNGKVERKLDKETSLNLMDL